MLTILKAEKEMLMKCPQCEAENVEGKKFCADCGSLLDTRLQAFVRSQVEECIQEQFKDRRFIEVETTEAISARFQKWGKLFLVPATILIALLAVILTLFGVSDYSDFRKTVHRASDEAAAEANTAKRQAMALQDTSNKVIVSMQKISDKISGIDKIAEDKIRGANKRVEGRMADP
jgi:uncharacterized membrane protein YvbJ